MNDGEVLHVKVASISVDHPDLLFQSAFPDDVPSPGHRCQIIVCNPDQSSSSTLDFHRSTGHTTPTYAQYPV